MPDGRLPSTKSTLLRVVKRDTLGRALDRAFDLFLTAKESERVTPRTLHNYHEFLAPFVDWLKAQGVTEPQSISAHHIRLYLVEIEHRPGLAGRETVSAQTVTSAPAQDGKWAKMSRGDSEWTIQ